ncbi:IGHMBP2 family helicase [Natroniella acetigena]|uniref:IGHMBP2 family helicase n=1 Tax=Natroniella acetigena TaxID=52004 RepID=UPI00200AE838|nr:IGHMBP2 family helicase [Natroniella acetigena]MCK8826176.1 IGHMBP2 family helicase [Natroniella acetigena]
MIDLIVKNLSDHIGPGDIVGAFTNEANIDGGQIGKIEFKGNNAIVEIEDEVAEHVMKVMNSNQIAGVDVGVEIDNNFKEELETVENYINKYKFLVQLEREEEMKYHEAEIKNLSGQEREKKGRAFLNLRGRDQGQAFAGKFVVKFMKQQQGRSLPDTEINIGDLIMISKNEPLNPDNPTGTVVEKTNYSITAVFDNQPPGFVYGKNLRLDLYVNDITFQRMLDALGRLESTSGRLKSLRSKLLGIEDLTFDAKENVEFSNLALNQSQREAVETALAAKDFFLIHGPPGTGKTVTAIEILEQAVQRQKKILATADSNTAVDNLVERLIKRGLNVLRIGHPVRVNPVLRQHTLDYLIEEQPEYKKAEQVREQAYKLLEQQKENIHPSGRWRRGLSNKQIKKLANQGKGSRGISSNKIKEMADWLELQDEIERLFAQVEHLEDETVKRLIKEADVICTTNSTAGSEVLAGEEFDLLVLDEATQATEPSALIPLVKADKVVLAGDHKQLPPTILNKEAEKEGLSKSLFERLLEVHSTEVKQMLKVQYRMNQQIMNFINQEFYEGELIAATEVKDWDLTELDFEIFQGNSPAERALNCKEAIAFFDTAGMNASEHFKQNSTSLQNRVEAELCTEIVSYAINGGIKEEQIAVITPYYDQVDLIKNLLKFDRVEVNTVDGFQGREKEVIVLSLVRSNSKGNIGFLRDVRRLNVSLSRAKKKLIVIGDSSTIGGEQIYYRLISYIQSVGYYYNL